MFAKADVNGPHTQPMFTFLKQTFDQDLKWNFTKYLVVDGKPVKVYSPKEDPSKIDPDIEEALVAAARL